ncbi:MAG: type II toxin-antitoxin system VapC family toxin [Nanoarchaeota archaeon]
MSYEFVIDSYAWIEYFRGTVKGEIAKKFIEGGKAVTSAISVAELSEKYNRENKDLENDLNFILSQTKLVDLSKEIAVLAGKINFENKKKMKNWGMADAIILATANLFNVKVVTGDEHFRTFNSIMID